AISVSGGTLTVTSVTFTNTTAANSADNGGAIYHNAATLLTVTNSSFTGNTATNGDGGAIVMNNNNPGSSLTITGSTFTNNTSTDDGGAIANASEPTRISNSTFAGNSITSSTGNAAVGGAIRNEGTADDTRITLSTFTNNSVTHTTTNDDNALGGAIQNEGSGFVLANVTFSGNSASYTGGSNNNAQGGALYTQASTTIHNVTFSGNSVTETGTGVATLGGNIFNNGTTVTVANTIVNSGTPDNCSGTITNGGNNIDSAATCGWAALLGSVSNTNPNLGALTGSPQYFPLNTGSPAINTGSNAICATATSTNNQSQNGLARPQGVNCEIGSYEAPATITLTLQKTVVNNNGGTALDTAWTLSATGPTNISGVEGNAAVTNAVVSAGNYTLSESVVSGYSNSGVWSCSGFTSGSQTDDDTLTLGAGDNVTCVITNDDISPVLTLVKTTTNDNGGTALDTAWTLNAAGPTNISGVEGNAAVTNAAVNAGTYTLTESGGPAGYTQTGLSCSGAADLNPADGLAITVGETVTCTFTNNDVAPTLTLAKTVTNDNGGTALDTAWTLNAAGPTNISGVEGAVAVTNAAVNAGTYTLTESGGPAGYTQTGLSCSGAADLNPADGLTLALGETVTCTFTNNDVAPTLTLVKTVTNDNGGTALDTAWTLNAAGPTNISGIEGAVAITNAVVSAGNYTLTESGGPAGYTQTGITCSGSDVNGADGLTLLPGETVTCTFANNDNAPGLTLLKTVVSDNGGTALDTAWTLNAAGPTPISGVEGAAAVTGATVSAGNYTLTESGGPSGYTQTGLSCSGAADTDLTDGLTIALGETVTCTFTNNDIAPTLTLVKTVVNDNGGLALDTNWTLSTTGPTAISGIEGAPAVTNATVDAGNYTLGESGPANYTQTGIACSGSDANGADGLTLLPGETVTCTYTNNDVAAVLTLLKTVINDNGGLAADTAWTLNAAGPTSISGVEGAVAVTNAAVNAGAYTLSESGGPSGYTQTSLVCSGAADANPNDGLTIALGETITCTFTNNDIAPTLTLVKDVTNNDGGT
ncbi:MAG: hypothetical protein JNM00_00005, partial [Flavobacteriales bacterium]|nr:hypothetical protein [Flavobacteriales bacterium]